jgi:hypothetical protein
MRCRRHLTVRGVILAIYAILLIAWIAWGAAAVSSWSAAT